MIVVKLEPGNKGISLGNSMELNYHIAHSGNHLSIPVLVPNPRGGGEMQEISDGVFQVEDEKVSSFLKIWPHWEKSGKDEFDDAIRWGNKKDEKRLELKSSQLSLDILKRLSQIYGREIDSYQAARGKTHLYSRFLFPAELYNSESPSVEHLEFLCARCLRHPQSSNVKPLLPQKLEGDEFKSFNVTGSQRVYLSCENALSVGVDETEFSKPWQDRWDNDYFLCHLIAYHQSILCQELSWSSFSKTNNKGEEKRNLDELNERYIEFCTHYDFSIISSQLNHQRTYRISREVLGVCQSSEEVSDEIQTRIEHQRNKLQDQFNDKQQAFNSLAVLFFILGCSTFLINLNIKTFNNDAIVKWDFSGNTLSQRLESLWLWVPISLSIILLFFSSST